MEDNNWKIKEHVTEHFKIWSDRPCDEIRLVEKDLPGVEGKSIKLYPICANQYIKTIERWMGQERNVGRTVCKDSKLYHAIQPRERRYEITFAVPEKRYFLDKVLDTDIQGQMFLIIEAHADNYLPYETYILGFSANDLEAYAKMCKEEPLVKWSHSEGKVEISKNVYNVIFYPLRDYEEVVKDSIVKPFTSFYKYVEDRTHRILEHERSNPDPRIVDLYAITSKVIGEMFYAIHEYDREGIKEEEMKEFVSSTPDPMEPISFRVGEDGKLTTKHETEEERSNVYYRNRT